MRISDLVVRLSSSAICTTIGTWVAAAKRIVLAVTVLEKGILAWILGLECVSFIQLGLEISIFSWHNTYNKKWGLAPSFLFFF
jgi:hypothetical protein